MKTKFLKTITGISALILSSCIVFLSCQKNAVNNQKIQSSNPTPDAIIAQAGADAPPYNLNVVMRNGAGGFGFVKFRQHPDTAKIINLDTWLVNLQPDHAYLLQRAVDSIKFGGCFSTSWLTLGLGLQPQAIHTDSKGYGFEPLFRDITALGRGTEFYIHFQVIDSLTSATVLTSDCLQYTVR